MMKGKCESGIIGGKEVSISRLDTHLWTVDVVKHTSDTDKEYFDGWVVDNEEDAKALYSEKVKELKNKEMI
jgi:hypothetical protein